jgi:2-polyprenyl-3-methyl-5-hydroxy-6-metoxy-1,4-benzoquinol methylase
MDASDIPKELLFRNLHELDFINRVFAGNAVSISGIKKILTEKNRLYHIVDLGCGGGGTMKQIAIWARTMGYQVKLTGIDKNADAIDYLINNCRAFTEISGVVSDYREYLKTAIPVDIIHCGLFCHHLNNSELIELFSLLNSKMGFVVNDLQRNWLAYYVVKIITRLLNGSDLAKNDGPVSVLRAFKLNELKKLLQNAHIKNFSIERRWAFRYLIIGRTEGYEAMAG